RVLRGAQAAASMLAPLSRHSRARGNSGPATDQSPLGPRFRGGDDERRAATGLLTWQGRIADAQLPFARLSVAEAFARHAGIDILATAPDPARPDFALLAAEAQKIGIAPH